MRFLSWNINGLRSAYKQGFLSWLYEESPDVLCLQEVKAEKDDLPDELKKPEGYDSFFSHSRTKKGYSGVGVYTKTRPEKVEEEIGAGRLDEEGRTLVLHFSEFVLVNAYFPNSGMDGRLDAKLRYNDAMLSFLEGLKKKKKRIILCGDFNVAHEEIDLARPKENEGHAGFREEERAWVDELVAAGFIDTFRHFYPEKRNAYSWWDQYTHARDRNVGWRIDYFFVSADALSKLQRAFILDYVTGSDHAPVGIEVDM